MVCKIEMQRNASKCRILLNTNGKVITKIQSTDIENKQSEKVLDNQLCFEKQINNVSSKAKTKHSALSRIAPLKNFNPRKKR